MNPYNVKNYYKLKKDGEYKHKLGMFEFFTDDIFTKDAPGLYTVHSGICMTGIEIPDEDLEYCEDTAKMMIV